MLASPPEAMRRASTLGAAPSFSSPLSISSAGGLAAVDHPLVLARRTSSTPDRTPTPSPKHHHHQYHRVSRTSSLGLVVVDLQQDVNAANELEAPSQVVDDSNEDDDDDDDDEEEEEVLISNPQNRLRRRCFAASLLLFSVDLGFFLIFAQRSERRLSSMVMALILLSLSLVLCAAGMAQPLASDITLIKSDGSVFGPPRFFEPSSSTKAWGESVLAENGDRV
jgi:hypothetical protein